MPRPTPPVPDYKDTIRPHARNTGLRLEEGQLFISLDEAPEITVPFEQVRALHGARIRHDSYSVTVPGAMQPDESGALDLVHREHDPVVLAMRADGVKEIWYLQSEAFNYRKALGRDAGFTTRENLDRLVHVLADRLAGATKDAFFRAWLTKAPLPPPEVSLLDFFKSL